MSNSVMESGERARAGRRGRAVAVVLVTILVVGAVLAPRMFGGSGESDAGAAGPGEMPPMPVDVDAARRGTVVDAVRATGHIEAVQAVELRSDEQGRVVELLFREGQAVAAGTPLVRIDDAMLRAQAERARADRDLAYQQRARVRRLRAENAASPADLERVEAAARSAEAALGVLELQIERSTVRAPFGGRVGQRFVSVGDYVTSATPLLTLQTTDPQHAVIEVPERHAGDLRLGQAVEFTVAAHRGRTFRGLVEFIDPVVQPESRTIVVKARAPNAEQLLKTGMFIEARLATGVRDDAVVVPEDALQPLRSTTVVWAVVDGKASRREVRLGSRSQGVVEILSGVEPGEQVVVGGLERMAEGMPVAPRPRTAPADSAGPTGPAG
jgi:membrane fusion protein (multidrug efflux system)